MVHIHRLGKGVRYEGHSHRFTSNTSVETSSHTGDLVYTKLLGKHIIIVSSEKIAKDLLEHRSRNYSDRPSLVTNEL